MGGGAVGYSIASLLDEVHAVLMPLKQPQTFVTVACVRSGLGKLGLNAPWLAIFRACASATASSRKSRRRRSPSACSMERRSLHPRSSALPGDLFAVLTDGLVEVCDKERRELGFDWAKGVLRSSRRLNAVGHHRPIARGRPCVWHSARRSDRPVDTDITPKIIRKSGPEFGILH